MLSFFSIADDQSDDDSSASVADLGYSPDKEEGRTQLHVKDHGHLEQPLGKDSKRPWLSPCRDVSQQISLSPLKCPDFEYTPEEGSRRQKTRRTSIRNKSIDKCNDVGLLESPRQGRRSDDGKDICKEKRRSQRKSLSPAAKKNEQSPNISDQGKRRSKSAKSFTETKTPVCPDTVNSSGRLSSTATLAAAAAELSKETTTSLQKVDQKTTKRARPSFSALVQSFTLPTESQNVASVSTDRDDNVFEDYFSPANHHKKSQRPLLRNLSLGRDIQVPFELDPVPKKRKQRRSESTGLETMKKRKLEESQSDKTHNQQSDANTEPKSHPQQDDKKSLIKGRRQSLLPFISTSETTTEQQKRRKSSSVQPAKRTEDNIELKLQTDSDVDDLSHTLESE